LWWLGAVPGNPPQPEGAGLITGSDQTSVGRGSGGDRGDRRGGVVGPEARPRRGEVRWFPHPDNVVHPAGGDPHTSLRRRRCARVDRTGTAGHAHGLPGGGVPDSDHAVVTAGNERIGRPMTTVDDPDIADPVGVTGQGPDGGPGFEL